MQRINFGFVAAAGRIPGASPLGFTGADALKNAPLEQQVDGVAAALLGGAISTDTRSVLLSGTNPLLKAAPSDATNTMTPTPPSVGPLNRPLPPIKGLNQVIGLALGSPEFQRR
jgi:hypothetical protein